MEIPKNALRVIKATFHRTRIVLPIAKALRYGLVCIIGEIEKFPRRRMFNQTELNAKV